MGVTDPSRPLDRVAEKVFDLHARGLSSLTKRETKRLGKSLGRSIQFLSSRSRRWQDCLPFGIPRLVPSRPAHSFGGRVYLDLVREFTSSGWVLATMTNGSDPSTYEQPNGDRNYLQNLHSLAAK